MVEERPGEEVEFDKLVVAAVTELVGPNNWVEDDPPDTNPVEPVAVVAALLRIKRSRRSRGFCWKSCFTSSTTWYWFNWVKMGETSLWP